VILAFEDLQWADSGLLDFIDYRSAASVAVSPLRVRVSPLMLIQKRAVRVAQPPRRGLHIGAEHVHRAN
jgi:hypothetical protein